MVLTLKIENDQELRSHVKDLISGQVKSIIREEIKGILSDTIHKKVKDTEVPNIEFLIKSEIDKMIRQELNVNSWGTNFIKQEASKVINELVRKAFSKGDVVS